MFKVSQFPKKSVLQEGGVQILKGLSSHSEQCDLNSGDIGRPVKSFKPK